MITDVAETIRAVCEMASEFRVRGNVSMIDLLQQSGYLSADTKIMEIQLEEYLREHPALIESWLIYSDDQRFSPAWMLAEPNRVDGNRMWALCQVAIGGDVSIIDRFSDEYAACSHFIKKEAESLSTLVK